MSYTPSAAVAKFVLIKGSNYFTCLHCVGRFKVSWLLLLLAVMHLSSQWTTKVDFRLLCCCLICALPSQCECREWSTTFADHTTPFLPTAWWIKGNEKKNTESSHVDPLAELKLCCGCFQCVSPMCAHVGPTWRQLHHYKPAHLLSRPGKSDDTVHMQSNKHS